MKYTKDDIVNVATKLGRLVNGGVVGYYAGGKTSEIMSNTIPDELVSVVERHKKVQLGASLAQSFIPGAGIVATSAAVASLWKMYYDINQVLGLNISENVGKSLTSAILTNLSSAGAQIGATAVSEGAKFIPFVGWIASAAISTVTTTAIVYGAAYLYLTALTKMYEAEGKFDLDYLTSSLEDEDYSSEYDVNDGAGESILEDELKLEHVTYDDYKGIKAAVYRKNYLDWLTYNSNIIFGSYIDPVENPDLIAERIKADLGIDVETWQFQSVLYNEMFNKLEELLIHKLDSDFKWGNVISAMPHGSDQDNFNMYVYKSVEIDGIGIALIGVVQAGTISVGDKIYICTKDNVQHESIVTWIEKFDMKHSDASAGDALGLGVDFDVNCTGFGVDRVVKYNDVMGNKR